MSESPSYPSGFSLDTASDDHSLRKVWILSMVASIGTVVGLLIYVNALNWHNGVPLGYDSYYYVGWINQVVNSGPLQFAASQHYVEFLYPIVASIPVYLGVSADTVEIVLPAVLACATVVATGYLARESGDQRFAILTVAFTAGWYALFAMVADFNGNLLAFPILLTATALLVRVANGDKTPARTIGIFLLLVGLAAASHVETTDFFIAFWLIAFLILGVRFEPASWKQSLMMVASAGVVSSPFTFAYFQGVSNGLGGQYCVYPPYWLRVFGPAAALAVIGIGVAAWRYKAPGLKGHYARLLLSWSALAIGIGVLGYVTSFPIVLSDRSLMLLPLPLVSALGGLWLMTNSSKVRSYSQTRLFAILAVGVPLLVGTLVFAYSAPAFAYFTSHGPSFVTCATK